MAAMHRHLVKTSVTEGKGGRTWCGRPLPVRFDTSNIELTTCKRCKQAHRGQVVRTIARIQKDMPQHLANALLALRRGDGCWCEMAIGNPMYQAHTPACAQAARVIEDAKRLGVIS